MTISHMNSLQTFEALNLLESTEIAILEILSKDLIGHTFLSERSVWLAIDKSDFSVSSLTLKSADSSSEVEERFFEEGFLKFGPTTGTYIVKFNSAQHQLLRRLSLDVPATLSRCITNYLALGGT